MARRTDPETRAKGAHFLHSEGKAVQRIVEAAALKAGETVLDVGAGTGSVARRVAAAVGASGKVVAIERDVELADHLRALELPNLDVIAGDALRVRLPKPLHAIVANPPFRILPGLLRRLLDHGFGRAVLVMPRELADRLTAEQKTEEYGKLTVEMALRAKCRLLFPLRRDDFDPPPEVACAVVSVTPKAAPTDVPAETLDAVLEAAWAARRKTLRHSLSPLAATLRIPPQAVTEALDSAGARTAVDVSPYEFGRIAASLARAQAASASRVQPP